MELEWNVSKRPKPSDKDCSVGENKGQSGMLRCCSVLCMYSSMATARQGQMVAAARWGLLADKARESATPESACAPRRAQASKRWDVCRGSEAEAEAENALLYTSGIWYLVSGIDYYLLSIMTWRHGLYASRVQTSLSAASRNRNRPSGPGGPTLQATGQHVRPDHARANAIKSAQRWLGGSCIGRPG
jgi:hypothetical protein